MTAWLHEHGFSYKKPAATPAKADSAKQEVFVAEYKRLVRQTPLDEPILFIDGVHPTMATKISYGWIKKGVRTPIATTASRTRVNIMGAINLEDMNVVTKAYDTIDSSAMVLYFDHLKAVYPSAKKLHLILDNGPYNTSAVTRQAASERNIILHYLPPYSPNLNPIERLWKVMNEEIRNNRFFASTKEFKDRIDWFFKVRWKEISDSMVDRINDNFNVIHSPLKAASSS